MFAEEIGDVMADLGQIPEKIAQILDQADPIRELARAMKDTPSVLFLGRHVGYPVALEGFEAQRAGLYPC